MDNDKTAKDDTGVLDEDEILKKIPSRYKEFYDQDDFEKFTYRKGYES